jgi:hypothetical protein
MYAVLNPNGTFVELREGEIDGTVNTTNRQKRYAVPYTQVTPTLLPGQVPVFDRREVTPNHVTDVFLAGSPPPRRRDDAQALARALVMKGVLTEAEIEAAR